MQEWQFWLLMWSLWVTNKPLLTFKITLKNGLVIEFVQMIMFFFCTYELIATV